MEHTQHLQQQMKQQQVVLFALERVVYLYPQIVNIHFILSLEIQFKCDKFIVINLNLSTNQSYEL
jgi:hypothetical protein